MFEQLMARLGLALDAQKVPYIIIGGQAVLQHGEPRFTRDIDISLGVDSSAVDQVLAATLACGLKPLVDSPKSFVERTYILPVHDPETEIRVDFAFTFSPFERQAIERCIRIRVGGYDVAFATAEDLIMWLESFLQPGDRVLFKASRAVALDQVVAQVRARLGG